MCSKKDQEEVVESPDQQAMNNIQNYQNDLFFHQLISHQHQEPSQHETFGAPSNNNNNNIGSGFNIFSQDSPLWPSIDPLSSSSSQASFYGSFFNRTRSHHQHQQGLHLGYEGFHGATSASHQEQFRILSEAMGPVNVQTGLGSFGLQGEIGMMKMTAQEIMDAKALAASKSHSESERRRRERINNHLAKLRSILPNTTKTDKASLLAEVIQHVKELKKETSLISETNLVPTEYDELTVALTEEEQTVNGKFVIKATVCCEDRLNLLQDMVKTLKALGLKTLKAEITTVSGRVKNVLFVTRDENSGEEETVEEYCVETIEEALKVVMENKSNVEETSSSGNVKRQRMSHNNTIIIVDQQQQHM